MAQKFYLHIARFLENLIIMHLYQEVQEYMYFLVRDGAGSKYKQNY